MNRADATPQQRTWKQVSDKSGHDARLLPFLRGRGGQSVVEYAVLAAMAIGALALMAVYIKHAVAGRWRGAADSIGEQYDARRTTSNIILQVNTETTTTSTLLKDQPLAGGGTGDVMETTTTIQKDETSRDGFENVGTPGATLWD